MGGLGGFSTTDLRTNATLKGVQLLPAQSERLREQGGRVSSVYGTFRTFDGLSALPALLSLPSKNILRTQPRAMLFVTRTNLSGFLRALR
jgi:hypothetical protein